MIPKNLFLAVLMLTLCACTGNRKEGKDPSEGNPTETVFTEEPEEAPETADTLELDDEVRQGEVPVSMDEVFDDFIFTFDQSGLMQRERIRFPLKVTEADGNVRYIQQRAWQHRYLFMQQEYCTVFWNSMTQMHAEQSPDIQQAEVQQIYLHSRQVSDFIFQRDSIGRWQLTEQRVRNFEQCELGSFLDFYVHFVSDSIFQRHHVHPHLRYISTDENSEYDTIEGTIDVDQWFEFRPELPQDVLTNIHTVQDYQGAQRIILQIRGISAGIENVLTFRIDNGEWRLTAFEN